MAINTVALTGRLTREPELKKTMQGTSVLNVYIAVDRYTKSESEKQADFFEVICWRSSADYLAQYAHKGDLIGVTGRLTQERYQDRDGRDTNRVSVIANNVQILRSKQNGAGASETVLMPTDADAPAEDSVQYMDISNDELPF